MMLLLINLIIIAALLAGFEYYLRSVDPFLKLPFDSSYYKRYQLYYPDLEVPKISPGSDQYSWGQVIVSNKFKFREREFDRPKPADTCRIVVLGDSFTWGIGLAEEERYTNLAQKALHQTFPDRALQVINLAQSGNATVVERNHLQNLKQLLSPDMIVIGFVYNDPQPRRQNYRVEQEAFEARYGVALDLFSETLVRVGLPQTAKVSREAFDNFIVWAGIIPAWEVGLQRTYEQDSAEWLAFEQALQDIKTISDELGLPTPIFLILNNNIYIDHPTSYSVQDSSLPIYLRWFHQAEETAASLGFRTYNYEKELLEQLTPAKIPLNELDSHPSAEVNQVYAQKLFEILAADIQAETLCRESSGQGAVKTGPEPLASERQMSIVLGDQVRFLGYTAETTTSGRNQTLTLSFGWQTLTKIDTNYRIFIQVLDGDGQPKISQETIPCQGNCPMPFWPAGVMAFAEADIIYWPERTRLVPTPMDELPYEGDFRDVHQIKFDSQLPSGEYRVVMGLYSPATGKPLAAYDEIAQSWLAGDHIILGTVMVD